MPPVQRKYNLPTGVYFQTNGGKYYGRIQHNSSSYTTKRYDNPKEALEELNIKRMGQGLPKMDEHWSFSDVDSPSGDDTIPSFYPTTIVDEGEDGTSSEDEYYPPISSVHATPVLSSSSKRTLNEIRTEMYETLKAGITVDKDTVAWKKQRCEELRKRTEEAKKDADAAEKAFSTEGKAAQAKLVELYGMKDAYMYLVGYYTTSKHVTTGVVSPVFCLRRIFLNEDDAATLVHLFPHAGTTIEGTEGKVSIKYMPYAVKHWSDFHKYIHLVETHINEDVERSKGEALHPTVETAYIDMTR